jgi:hypothetical protein
VTANILRASPSVKRETFTTSRLSEFASVKELVAQTGTAPADWPLMAIRELADNALDHAEELGVPPRIYVTVARDKIRVRDFGDGIPPETVSAILDFNTRTSAREAYVAPDRGRQGNALKTVMALALALSGRTGRVVIAAQDVHHEITFRIDAVARTPVIEHRQQPGSVKIGTSVTIHWPAQSSSELVAAGARFLPLLSRITDFNPHLEIRGTWAQGDLRERLTIYATDPDWPKWRPSAPTSAHWYRRGDLERLAGACIKRDRELGAPRLLRDFLGQFDGLSGTGKRSRVLAGLGLQRATLDSLLTGADFDHALVERLLVAMQEAARPVKPDRLGPLGKDALRRALAGYGGADLESFSYAQAKGVGLYDVPYVAEAAFVYRPHALRRFLSFGLNWSPALKCDGDTLFNLNYELGESYCDEDAPIAVIAHLICPRPMFVDRGKSRLADNSPGLDAVRQVIAQVTTRWKKQRRAEIRDASAEHRRQDQLRRQQVRRLSIREAVLQCLPEAYREVSDGGKFPALARQIYYKLRPKVLELISKQTLDAAYVSYTLLPEYLQTQPQQTRDWRIHFKARGNLREPHTRRKIPLGTAEVASYRRQWTNGESYTIDGGIIGPWEPDTCGPYNRYSALVIVEKEGIAGLLLEVELGELRDIAIVGNEGQSTEAGLALADALGLPVFVLHDFDRAGLVIAANLRTGTWRHRYQCQFPVIDIGLRLHQIAGLEDEPINAENLRSVGDERLRGAGASEAEIAFLRHRRVELNALSTNQLVELVEEALDAHGITKVIPTDESLISAWRAMSARGDLAAEVDKLNVAIAGRWKEAAAPDDLADRVRAELDRHPTLCWDAALRRIVEKGAAP